MDKTTTWLVRGASAIVIISGIGYLVKPQLSKIFKPSEEEISDRAYKKCESIPVSKLIEWAKCMGENDPNFIID